jgi:hypothetical protein
MSKRQVFVTCLGLAFAIFAGPDAMAAGRHVHSAAYTKVEQLIRLMDKDKNGQVSKAEFMQFMGEEFDRIDVDRSGSLTRGELSQSVIIGGPRKHVGGTGK